jgi:hypothetical protein
MARRFGGSSGCRKNKHARGVAPGFCLIMFKLLTGPERFSLLKDRLTNSM